jgi:hypothetical protein
MPRYGCEKIVVNRQVNRFSWFRRQPGGERPAEGARASRFRRNDIPGRRIPIPQFPVHHIAAIIGDSYDAILIPFE